MNEKDMKFTYNVYEDKKGRTDVDYEQRGVSSQTKN